MIRDGNIGFLRRSFTLVELIVVLVIVSMLTALAVVSLRGESPSSLLNRQSLALEAWCAAIRYRCAEEGVDYVVRMMPEERCLYACAVDPDAETEPSPPESGPLRMNFPDNFEIFTVEGAENAARETAYVDIFRFFPGGGGVCVNRPVLRVEELSKHFDLSFLHGRLLSADGDGSDLEARR